MARFTYHSVAKSSPKTCYTETHSRCLPPSPHPSLLSLPQFLLSPAIAFFSHPPDNIEMFWLPKIFKRDRGMCGRRNGWISRWMDGDLFSHDLVLMGPASLPHSVSLPHTDCVCDQAGSSCLSWAFWHSSQSCPPIPLPPAVFCPLRVCIFTDSHRLLG